MKISSLLFIICAVSLLSACGLTRKSLGFEQVGPDETQVVKKEPLILPPGYNVRPQINSSEDAGEDE